MCVIFLVFLEFFNIVINASVDNSNIIFIFVLIKVSSSSSLFDISF